MHAISSVLSAAAVRVRRGHGCGRGLPDTLSVLRLRVFFPAVLRAKPEDTHLLLVGRFFTSQCLWYTKAALGKALLLGM